MRDAFLIVGQVMHERLRPVHNRFVYPVFCLRFNVDKLAQLDQWWFGVDRPHLIGLRSQDHGEGRPGPWMRSVLAEAGIAADGEIWLQTFPRVFGYVFNPVSFWYCYDAAHNLVALLADVRNTFGERHRYLLTAPGKAPIKPDDVLQCQKVFHVSPFCEVEGRYAFRFRDSDRFAFVGIDYHDAQGLLLKTAIGGRCLPFDMQHVWRALFKQPFLTFGVVVRIHIQAFRLWRRQLPFFHKPAPPHQPLSHSHSEGSHA